MNQPLQVLLIEDSDDDAALLKLELQRAGRKRFSALPVPPSLGVWEQFLAVREGSLPNPCPPEIGLHMARLYDAIQASAAQGGSPVKVS